MGQWWMERLRDRRGDRAKSLAAVGQRAEAELREKLGDYDAFVEPARAVTDGLLVGTATSSLGTEIPIRLSWGNEYAHWLVQGGTGTGKTTWAGSLLRQELAKGRPFGLVDCKGDLFKAGIRWAAALGQAIAPARREELRASLVVINPFAEHLVPLNVCSPLPGWSAEVQAYEVTLALSRLFDTSLGLHMGNILRHLLYLLIEARLSFLEAPQLLQDEVLRGTLAIQSSNPAVREFFLGGYEAVPQASKDALLARLQGLLLPENIRLMLGAEGIVDLRGTLDRGQPLLVFLGKGPGVPEEQVTVLGNLFLQLLLQAVYARGSGGQRPYLLAVDEFINLLGAPTLAQRFETALTTVRSFGLSLMLIHQNVAQLPPTLREIMLANCDLVALFRTSARNAEFFGDFLPDADPSFLEHAATRGAERVSREALRRFQLEALQRLPSREAFFYDHRRPHRAIRLRAGDIPEPHVVAGLSGHDLEEVIRREGWEDGGVVRSRQQLRSEIEARKLRLRQLVNPRNTAPDVGKSAEPGNGPPPKKPRRPRLG
jgi:hypothetical protein